jgi:hypothetical protein
MHDDHFVKLSAAFEKRSPIQIDGEPFAVWLIDIRKPIVPGKAVDVVFGAKGNNTSHTGELHLGPDRLDEEAYVVDHAVATIERIVRGELPPGTLDYL